MDNASSFKRSIDAHRPDVMNNSQPAPYGIVFGQAPYIDPSLNDALSIMKEPHPHMAHVASATAPVPVATANGHVNKEVHELGLANGAFQSETLATKQTHSVLTAKTIEHQSSDATHSDQNTAFAHVHRSVARNTEYPSFEAIRVNQLTNTSMHPFMADQNEHQSRQGLNTAGMFSSVAKNPEHQSTQTTRASHLTSTSMDPFAAKGNGNQILPGLQATGMSSSMGNSTEHPGNQAAYANQFTNSSLTPPFAGTGQVHPSIQHFYADPNLNLTFDCIPPHLRDSIQIPLDPRLLALVETTTEKARVQKAQKLQREREKQYREAGQRHGGEHEKKDQHVVTREDELGLDKPALKGFKAGNVLTKEQVVGLWNQGQGHKEDSTDGDPLEE